MHSVTGIACLDLSLLHAMHRQPLSMRSMSAALTLVWMSAIEALQAPLTNHAECTCENTARQSTHLWHT